MSQTHSLLTADFEIFSELAGLYPDAIAVSASPLSIGGFRTVQSSTWSSERGNAILLATFVVPAVSDVLADVAFQRDMARTHR